MISLKTSMPKGIKLTVICSLNRLVLLCGVLLITTLNAKEPLEKVSLQLQWFDQFQFAGYYIAKEKGFYRDVGLDVTLKPYRARISSADEVVSQRATYGVGRSTLIIERSKGKPIVLLAAIFQVSPLVLLSLKRDDLLSTDDFNGKRLTTLPDSTASVAMQAMIASQGIDLSQMTLLEHSFNLNNLINGTTDLMSCYRSNEPYTLKQRGYDYTLFDPREYGFDFYGDLLFTSEEEAQQHPKRVQRFLEASLKGWTYAFEHIQESAEIIYKHYNTQHKTMEALLYEANILKELAYRNDLPLGHIESDKIHSIFDIYKILRLIHNNMDVDAMLFSKRQLHFSKKERAYIDRNTSVNVCIDLDFPPYTLKDADEYSGISIDFFKLVAKKSGLEFNFIPVNTRAEAAIYIQKGRCQVIPHINSQKKSHPLLKPTHSYILDNIALVTPINSPYIDNLSEFNHRNIAIISGIKYFTTLLHQKYPSLNLIEVLNPKLAFQRVRDSQFDGFLGPYRALSYAIQKSYIGDLKIALKLESPLIEISMGVKRNNTTLLNILNKTLTSITPEEEHLIYQRWIPTHTLTRQNYTFLMQLFGVMALIVAVFLYRQSLLKKKNLELEQLQNELEALNHLLEQKVSQTVNELRKKDQLMMQQSRLAQLGEMISMIAHQWRQPLAAISSTVVGVKLKNALNKFDLNTREGQQAYRNYLDHNFEQIENYILTLSNTIDDFRNFYKSGKISSSGSINRTIEKTLKIIESSLVTDNISLVKRFHSKSTVLMYENELLQVFLNLIKNAQDNFKERQTQHAKLIITTYDLDEGIGIDICDNGGGIDERIHDQIYDPYFSTKNKKNGTGLGLYMSKMIIEEHHHGKLTHYNTDGGVCFKITMPLD